MMDVRDNKPTQEDEPHIGMGDATPFEYLARLDLVMVRADDAMHDYLCRRIDAA